MPRTHILKGFADIDAALWVHAHHLGLGIDEMVACCLAHHRSVVDKSNFEAAQLLHEWGLADKATRARSGAGASFHTLWQTQRAIAVDILHALQYQRWTVHAPDQHPASWAYQSICDTLWQTQSLPKAADFAALIATRRAAAPAGRRPAPQAAGHAFSVKSVNDAYDWLLPLRPPVLLGVMRSGTGRTFSTALFIRCAHCSLPLVIMAVSYVLQESARAWGVPHALDPTTLDQLCAACLLEPVALPILLAHAAARYPHLLRVATAALPVVNVARPVRVEDFA